MIGTGASLQENLQTLKAPVAGLLMINVTALLEYILLQALSNRGLPHFHCL